MTDADYDPSVRHSCSITEVLNKIFEYDDQHYSLSEILSIRLQTAEHAYLNESNASPNGSVSQKTDCNLADAKEEHRRFRDLTIELNTAADNINQGRDHPTLVLAQKPYAGPGPQFTLESLNAWSKKRLFDRSKNTTAPEPQADQKSDSPLTTAQRNQLRNVYLLATVLKKLIDELTENGSVDTPDMKIHENKDIDFLQLSRHISSLSSRESRISDEKEPNFSCKNGFTLDPTLFAIAQISQCLAHTAEALRARKVMKFKASNGQALHDSFLDKDGTYVSTRIAANVKYLLSPDVPEEVIQKVGTLGKLLDLAKPQLSVSIPEDWFDEVLRETLVTSKTEYLKTIKG